VGGTALAAAPPKLEALTPTSGTGAERVLDGNPATGWRPDGDPMNEGVLLRLEQPTSFHRVSVQPCAGSPSLSADVMIDGASICEDEEQAMTGCGSEQPIRARSVFVKVRESTPDQVCVGEIQLLDSAGKRLDLKPPRAVKGRIQASSVLAPADAYHPGFLFDGRTDFGWVEGGKGTGAGESITLTLEAPLELVAIELWNGYQRSIDHFRKNARAGSLSLSVDGGAPISLGVKDTSGAQKLALPAPVKGSTFKLTVEKAIAGSRYPDLVLSELRLVDSQGPLTVQTPDVEERRKAFQAELAGSSLAQVVDQSFHKHCPAESGFVDRSFKLRSNHTFVFYDAVYTSGVSELKYDETLDGAWVVKTKGKPWTTIELFGRRHRVDTESWMPYGDDNPKTESTRIGGGKLEIARVADMDKKGFEKLVAEWAKGPQKAAVSCVGPGGFSYEALVKAEALFVRGPAVTELLAP
jgi:hypothetical protein